MSDEANDTVSKIFTYTASGVGTFFITGPVYNNTVRFVVDYAVENYSDAIDWLVYFGWWPVCALLTFGLCRAVVLWFSKTTKIYTYLKSFRMFG